MTDLVLYAMSEILKDSDGPTAVQFCESVHDRIDEIINEPFITYMTDCILNSVSPVIRIVNHSGTICINRDAYGVRDAARFILKNTDDSSAVYIDGVDVLDWT